MVTKVASLAYSTYTLYDNPGAGPCRIVTTSAHEVALKIERGANGEMAISSTVGAAMMECPEEQTCS